MNTKLVEHRQVWKIDNFSRYLGKKEDWSTDFEFALAGITRCRVLQWNLTLDIFYNRQQHASSEIVITLLGVQGKFDNDLIFANASLSVIDKDGKPLRTSILKTGTKLKTRESYVTDLKLLNKDITSNLLPNGQLTIECNIAYSKVRANILGTEKLFDERRDLLESLFKELKFTDVTLRVKGRDIKSHKAILATASPVFEAMFRSRKKSIKNLVEIQDVEPEVMEQMLKFIYTRQVPNKEILDVMGSDLHAVADRFELDKLKAVAEKHLATPQISIDNATKLLVLADLYSDQDLKDCVTRFIVENMEEIKQTADWNNVVKNDPRLLDLILATVAKI